MPRFGSSSTLLNKIGYAPDEELLDELIFDREELNNDLLEFLLLGGSDDTEPELPNKVQQKPAFSVRSFLATAGINAAAKTTVACDRECPLCFCEYDDDETTSVSIGDCAHRVCRDCLSSYCFVQCTDFDYMQHEISRLHPVGNNPLASRLEYFTVVGVKCPIMGCHEVIDVDTVYQVCNERTIGRFDYFALRFALENMTELIKCPRGCGGYLQDVLSDPDLPKGHELGCMLLCSNSACRLRALEKHEREKRRKLSAWAIENAHAHERFGKWLAEQNVKCCPHCHVAIEKWTGCHHMYCTNCKKPFDWNHAPPVGTGKHWYRPNDSKTTRVLTKKIAEVLASIPATRPDVPGQ